LVEALTGRRSASVTVNTATGEILDAVPDDPADQPSQPSTPPGEDS
jgi:hypothetical protein